MRFDNRFPRLGVALLASLLAAACVTINIYFPAAEAREAAEQIVEDVLGGRGETPKSKDERSEPQAGLERPTSFGWTRSLIDLLIPAAHASTPDFNVDTPEIRRLQASMRSRNASLQPFYDSGAIGFSQNAQVAVRDLNAVALKDRARVQALVDAENRDRSALYQAIAKANGHPEWEGQVRSVFARTWIDKAARGWWFQNPQGQWQKR